MLDPGFNALHIAMLRAADEHPDRAPPDGLRAIERKAVYLGAAALSKPERRALLEHPATMARLHLAAWLHWRSEHRAGLGDATSRCRHRRQPRAARRTRFGAPPDRDSRSPDPGRAGKPGVTPDRLRAP